MKKIPISPFIISLQGVGTFPPSRPRVIWIGISEGQDELSSIITFLNKNLKSLGFKPEARTDSAHLTIGRVKFINDKKSLLNLLQKWKDHPFGKINVTSIQFKKSLLTSKGPVYTTLKQVPD
jgi:2'-5' RNA ligase